MFLFYLLSFAKLFNYCKQVKRSHQSLNKNVKLATCKPNVLACNLTQKKHKHNFQS